MVKKDVFKALGASGVMEMGKNLQIIFGTQSDSLKEEIRSLMTNTVSATAEGAKPLPELNVSASKTMIKAPASGKVIPLEQVPDETFKQKLLGNGVAIERVEGTFIAPVAGTACVNYFLRKSALTIQLQTP